MKSKLQFRRCFVPFGLITSILLTFSLSVGAQRVIFKKDVREQIKRVYEDSTGPNGNKFTHTFIGLGMIIPINETDSAAITENVKSNQFYAGLREKFKINNSLALNLELIYIHQKFNIRQDEKANIFSHGVINDVQKFNTNSIGLGGSVRINYAKRGNVIGRYIDIGGDIGFVFANRLFMKNRVETATNSGAEILKTSLHQLDFVNPLMYSASVRAGFNHLVFFARYKLNDQFRKSDHFYPVGKIPELPRISIGLEIALYK